MGNGKRAILNKNFTHRYRRNLYCCLNSYFIHFAKKSAPATNFQLSTRLKYRLNSFEKRNSPKCKCDGLCSYSIVASKIQSLAWILCWHALWKLLGSFHQDYEFLIWISRLSRRHSWASYHTSVDWYSKHSRFRRGSCTQTWTNACSNHRYIKWIDSSEYSSQIFWVPLRLCKVLRRSIARTHSKHNVNSNQQNLKRASKETGRSLPNLAWCDH